MPFDFRQQDISLQYESTPQLLQEVRTRAAGGDPHLNVNSMLSKPDLVVLQSPTSSTIVEVRADRAVMRTKYFGEYAPQAANDRRSAYSREKAARLLDILSAAGAVFRFVGIVTTARCSITEAAEQAAAKARLQARVPGLSFLAQGEVPFDFVLRASRVVEPHRFSIAQLSWYQERSFEMTFDRLAGPSERTMQVHDWEMTLVDEGLEFRYDQNNKRGLLEGKREWSRAEMSGVIEGYLTDLPTATATFASIMDGG